MLTKKILTFLISSLILLFTACNNSTENTPIEAIYTDKTTESKKIFTENEEGILEENEVPISEDDSIQVQDTETGKWVKMTMKEANKLEDNKK